MEFRQSAEVGKESTGPRLQIPGQRRGKQRCFFDFEVIFASGKESIGARVRVDGGGNSKLRRTKVKIASLLRAMLGRHVDRHANGRVKR